MSGVTSSQASEQQAVRGLKTKRLELLLQIRELELELEKMNLDLHRQGVDEAVEIMPLRGASLRLDRNCW